jgi:hypothetical protein
MLVAAGSASADLVVHWALEEGAGTVASDSSGNGNDGTLVNSPEWVEGRLGGGLHFGGDAAQQYVSYSLPGGAEVWTEGTIAVWVQLDSVGQIQYRSPFTNHNPNSAGIQFDVDGGNPGNFRLNPGGVFFGPATTEWAHLALTFEAGTGILYYNGEQATTTTLSDSQRTFNLFSIGANRNRDNWMEGAVDELRIYDHPLTGEEIQTIMVTSAGRLPHARRPSPADGTLLEQTWVSLMWGAGDGAVTHDLYFGTGFDDVNDGAEGTYVGNLASTQQVVGFPGFPAPEGLTPGTTYYWRVDEVNDANATSPWKGDVWSFTVPPKTAYNAYPSDGAENVLDGVVLSWTGGFGVKLHNIYFGDNFDEVSNASGALPLSDPTFTPPALEAGKTYYWRVDQFDGAATNRGDVWSFTTVPEIAVTDPSLKLWWTLDEGNGTTAVDRSGHGSHGAISGDAQWADGFQGTALTFGSDVYVESVGYDGPAGASARTCCAWIRATVDGNQNIMSWGQNVAGQKWRMRVEGAGVLRVEVNGGYHYGVTQIVDGSWHHVAVTFEDDGTPDVLDTLLYVDGQLDATGLSQATAIDTAAGPVRIGESPWHNAPFWDQIDDACVYDKVLTAEEIQQVMLGNTKLAGNPQPKAYAVVDIRQTTSLSWSRGDSAASHDVYFGADRDAVANATNESPEFQGNQTALNLSVADKIEFGGGDYFWRIDEVEGDGTVHAGTIWKFTVPDYLVVDDIESYNDLAEEDPASNRVYVAWIDGFGTTTNGALIGNMDVPLTERGNVHGGLQAMPYTYDTIGKTSEATLTLTERDWSSQGVTKLSLWFRGDAANTPERMFVALNGNAVVYHDDTDATLKSTWTEWVIDLATFGADLTNVSTVTIGFGTKGSPAAGGTGTMYFDDIRLYK